MERPTVLTVVGARPQFVKMAPVSRQLAGRYREVVVHTGQHYDPGMSQRFFDELGIAAPDHNLGVGSASHGAQTGRALEGVERIIEADRPDVVLVYGDTNSTLAGALAAVKLQVPVAHVEAGLRSFNRRMPEETNRVLTDHCSRLLFAPTQTAVENLRREGIEAGVHLVGDVMLDAAREALPRAAERFPRLAEVLRVEAKGFVLSTVHRAENTDDPARLAAIVAALVAVPEPVVLPLHPRTRKLIADTEAGRRLRSAPNLRLVDPVGYLDMLALEANARVIVTDSGGVQKEGYFAGTPVVTLREETEWPETVAAGWNQVVGTDPERILAAVRGARAGRPIAEYGDGTAAAQIAGLLELVIAS